MVTEGNIDKFILTKNRKQITFNVLLNYTQAQRAFEVISSGRFCKYKYFDANHFTVDKKSYNRMKSFY